MPFSDEWELPGDSMPRGRSTFTKRQKEQTRQQRQRDKAERRDQRKQEKAVAVRVDQISELGESAATPAALFELGAGDVVTGVDSTLSDRIGE
jgi:flagellar motor switch protein FliM